MATYLTRTAGIMDPNIPHKQEAWTKAGLQLQILPISLFYYPVDSESPEQLNSRLDGILSGVKPDDDIIIQLPIYLADRYLEELVTKIKLLGKMSSTKLIFIINDLPQKQLTPQSNFVHICNQADQLIVATPEMGRFLRRLHINVPMTYFYFWDFYEPELMNLPMPNNTRAVNTFQNEDWYSYPFHLQQQGGYGLVWPYDKHGSSWTPDVATERFIAAGLPLITKSKTALANFIQANNVGLVVNQSEEIAELINQISDEDYQKMCQNMQRWSKVVREGGCLTAALATALGKLNEDKRRGPTNADQ